MSYFGQLAFIRNALLGIRKLENRNVGMVTGHTWVRLGL